MADKSRRVGRPSRRLRTWSEVKGTIKEVALGNPHPMFTLEARTDDGKVENWLVGGPAINRMEVLPDGSQKRLYGR